MARLLGLTGCASGACRLTRHIHVRANGSVQTPAKTPTLTKADSILGCGAAMDVGSGPGTSTRALGMAHLQNTDLDTPPQPTELPLNSGAVKSRSGSTLTISAETSGVLIRRIL